MQEFQMAIYKRQNVLIRATNITSMMVLHAIGQMLLKLQGRPVDNVIERQKNFSTNQCNNEPL